MEHRVQRLWTATVGQIAESAVPLEPGTNIIEVFDRPDLNRQLLILGEPGAGKTSMMLELAQELGDRAFADNAAPIPVLVNLSSWKDPKQGMVDWLVNELNSKYGLRKNLAQEWLTHDQLLPLLDGLDEVAPEHQHACATAINTWLTGGELEQRPCGILICCRREEFEQVVRQPLNLYGAIYIQPLTPEQIADYFSQFGLQDVWATVQQDDELQGLLTKPLFLSMFGLVQTQGKFSLTDWQQRTTSDQKIEYLLDTYWDATMSRELIIDPNQRQQGICSKTYGTKRLPEREAVQRSLVFAAKMLDANSSTELLIEKMQPVNLVNRQQQWAYRLIFGLIFGLTSGLIFGLIVGLIGGLIFGLTGGLIVALLSVLLVRGDTIAPVEAISISMSREGRREILHSLQKGLNYGLTIGLIVGLIVGPILGLLVGLNLVLIVGLIIGLKADIQSRIQPNQGIKNSIRNMLIVSAIALVFALPLKLGLEYWLPMMVDPENVPMFVAIELAIFIGFGVQEGGGQALVQHVALRLVLASNHYAPLRYDLLLNYCTERLLLQRVGGRYRFMHKLLQDHFAKMKLD